MNNSTIEAQKPGFFSRLSQGLQKTRARFTEGVNNIFLGKKSVDADLLAQLENHLILADVGIQTTKKLMANLTQKLNRQALKDPEALCKALQADLRTILLPCDKPLVIGKESPFIILTAGVNGVGKTTTIGKLAKYLKNKGYSVLLAAGDTFRAAAVEQLEIWGERNQIHVVSQKGNADSAAVIFDAIQAAKARNIDVVIADTAGRLHTKDNLMEEMKKIKRVIAKFDPFAPHETLLVLDAGIGQNAVIQAKEFHEALNITGIALTKLDGTAKGGVIFAIADQLEIPIRFIGVGEQIDDLKPFESSTFVDALFSPDLK
jgi:fused signal recognition particle receptor